MRQMILTAVILAAPAAAAAQEMPVPKPAPEHALLKKFVGTWDAAVAMPMFPESKGTMVWKLDLNGFWLSGRYTGNFAGQEFRGRDHFGYDPNKKKYITVWIDSFSPGMMRTESTYNAKTKTLTGYGSCYDQMTGKPCETKDVLRFVSDDKLVGTFYRKGEGEKEFKQVMSVTYTRRK